MCHERAVDVVRVSTNNSTARRRVQTRRNLEASSPLAPRPSALQVGDYAGAAAEWLAAHTRFRIDRNGMRV